MKKLSILAVLAVLGLVANGAFATEPTATETKEPVKAEAGEKADASKKEEKKADASKKEEKKAAEGEVEKKEEKKAN